jgi:Tfp pilus assembly protein PilF
MRGAGSQSNLKLGLLLPLLLSRASGVCQLSAQSTGVSLALSCRPAADFGAQSASINGVLLSMQPITACERGISQQPGFVALVVRGQCSFLQKALHAQEAGASAVLIADNVEAELMRLTSAGDAQAQRIHIPVAAVSKTDIDALMRLVGTDVRLAFAFGWMHIEQELLHKQKLEGNPEDSLAWHNLGHALGSQGKLAEATECYQRGLALSPPPALASSFLRQLGVMHNRMGQLPEAADKYEQALQHTPSDLSLLLELASLYADKLQKVGRAAELEYAAWTAMQQQGIVDWSVLCFLVQHQLQVFSTRIQLVHSFRAP